MGKIIEGVWDCVYCGTKKIRGSIRECPVCGKFRDSNTKFYIDNPIDYVEENLAKKINKSPDWLCSYCDSFNSDSLSECQECGASRESSKLNYHQNLERKRKKQEEKIYKEKKSEIYNNETSENIDNKIIEKISENKKNKSVKNREKRNNIFKISSIVLLSIIFIVGIIYLFTPKMQEVIIKDFSWERSFNIEEYKTVEENDWILPSNARLLYQQSEIKTYVDVIDHYETKTRTYTEQVIDHYETVVVGHRDLGNGYFEEITSQQPVYRTETKTETYQEPVYRQEPVFATKYYYEIDKWVYKTKISTSGEGKNPEWGEYNFQDNERKGSSFEKYKIKCILKDGKEKEYNLDYDVWNKLNVGEEIRLKVNIFGDAELIIEEQKITYWNIPIGYFYIKLVFYGFTVDRTFFV